MSLAKALCVRHVKARKAETPDFQSIDAAILAVETEANRLTNMKTWTETIQSNSGKILEEVRKMKEGLDYQIHVLKESVGGLKQSVAEAG